MLSKKQRMLFRRERKSVSGPLLWKDSREEPIQTGPKGCSVPVGMKKRELNGLRTLKKIRR